MMSQMPPTMVGEPMDIRKLYDAVDLILSLQVHNELYVRNHESLQRYNIVHFEHKFLWFCFWFPHKASYH